MTPHQIAKSATKKRSPRSNEVVSKEDIAVKLDEAAARRETLLLQVSVNCVSKRRITK